MKASLKQGKSYPATITLLFILSLLSIGLSAVLGEIAFVLAVAFYASLITFEKGTKVLSIICAAIGIGILFIPFLVPAISIWSAASVVCGFALYLLFRFGNSKCDTALVLTLLTCAVMVLSFVCVAYLYTSEFSLDTAVEWFCEAFDNLKVYLISSIGEMNEYLSAQISEIPAYSQMGELALSEEMINEAFDLVFDMIISFVVISAFVLVGLAIKLFCFIVKKNTYPDNLAHTWNFAVPSIYAYLFVIVFLLSSFVSLENSFGIVIVNLSNIFTVIFAYLGFKALKAFFTKKRKRFLAYLITIGGILLLSSVALDVLSVFGLLSTLRTNKSLGSDNVNQDKK